ncbi:flavohemoglobin expression-modulating QEGLA motif protein [bacterium SCSIO 12741]|nr:flavohemoglobin expression-modulating QEGLA motif protein [bacterium SCSIO 12741]
MLRLSVDEIIQKIESGQTFEAISQDRSFRIKIEKYVPFLCAAIHNGHGLRPELEEISALSEYERWYEEDPYTIDFVRSFPMTIEGMDSRYEYDLNRGPEGAVFEEAWGKQVWTRSLSDQEKQQSLDKHAAFYQVIDALCAAMMDRFSGGLVYDIHSYNYKRHDRETPVFNIGSERVDQHKFGAQVEKWRDELSKIKLPNTHNLTQINGIFYGRGYLLEHVSKRFEDILVLATEVKKVYCDELTGESFPKVIEALHQGFKRAILNHTSQFSKKKTTYRIKKKSELLSGTLSETISKIDRLLYRTVRDFELLEFVNPVNLEQERRRFYASNYQRIPQFHYKQIHLDTWRLKRTLSQLPIEDIRDISIQNLYKEVAQAYMDKIDMLSTLGTSKFKFNSLRYFGEPSAKDIDNARYLLYCPDFQTVEENADLDVEDASDLFRSLGNEYGFEFKIKVSDRVVSPATVLNARKTVVLKKGAQFSQRSLQALGNHEIGVHMVTTMNSNIQPLKIFNVGLPRNTMTQEGLAVLSELLSGSMGMTRLWELAHRVFAVKSVVDGASFVETFKMLHEDFQLDRDRAFNLSTRVHRGGGFTKEHLYLEGFRRVLKRYKAGVKLDNLLIGKTSLEFHDTINEMIERKILSKPHYVTKPFNDPVDIHPNLSYVLSGLK